MLPQIRSDEHLFAVPKFNIKKEDIEDFSNELKGFHENFRDCFSRSESRDHFYNYMVGQFSDLERCQGPSYFPTPGAKVIPYFCHKRG